MCMCMNVRIYLSIHLSVKLLVFLKSVLWIIYESNATCVGENLVDDLKVQKRYGNEVKSVEQNE